MKTNWILLGVWVAVGVGAVVALGVLGFYGYYLGPISKSPDDWGSFGSVMAGAFTLLSSFATIGTLLFLYLQQLNEKIRQEQLDIKKNEEQIKHDKVVEKQLRALTFDQYLNHRKVFIERLHEQSVYFNGDILFADPDRIYTAIFSKNSPVYCEYEVELVGPENAKAHDLSDCLEIYRIIQELLNNYSDMEKHLDLILKVMHLDHCLGMSYVGRFKDGDIYFKGVATGLNIYDLPYSLRRIGLVLNSILFFTGNEAVGLVHHKAEGHLLRDAMYKTLRDYRRAKGAFEIKYEIEALPFLHELYEISQLRFSREENLFIETAIKLDEIFSSSEEMNRLKEFEYADRVTDIFHSEIKDAESKFADDPEKLQVIKRADKAHWAAMERLGVIR